MHEYVQKSIRTTLPRSALSESGLSPGVLNQAVIPVKLGARPRFGRFVLLAMKTVGFCDGADEVEGVVVVVVVVAPATRWPLCELPWSVAAQVAFLPSSRALAAANWFWCSPLRCCSCVQAEPRRFDVVLQCAGVARHVALQSAEPVEGDGQRGDAQHHAGHLAHGGQVAAQRRPGRRGALGHDRQDEQRHGDAEGVEERDEKRGRADVMVRGRHRDGGEHRSGARARRRGRGSTRERSHRLRWRSARRRAGRRAAR